MCMLKIVDEIILYVSTIWSVQKVWITRTWNLIPDAASSQPCKNNFSTETDVVFFRQDYVVHILSVLYIHDFTL